MAYEEISKVHKELGKLIEDSFEIRRKVAREFADQNDIALRDLATGNVDAKTLLDFNRYISDNLGKERGKSIPEDVKIERFEMGNISAEWIYVPGASEDKVFYNLFGGGALLYGNRSLIG